MSYYVFSITSPEGMALVKNATLINQFEKYKEAKQLVKELRGQQSAEVVGDLKIVFAESQLHAEELLLEKRQKPTLMEHER